MAGVYADLCVLETVRTLAAQYPAASVEVVPAACLSYSESNNSGAYNWSSFPMRENIHLVPAPVEPAAIIRDIESPRSGEPGLASAGG